MRRSELEHVIRAAGAIAETDELIVIGSQAILASAENPPPELTVSMEVDLYPIPDTSKADLIDGSIGEESPFHETFGYYAHGIGPETAVVPSGWRDRLVLLSGRATCGVKGYCLHPIDIAVSKLAAGREKDLRYVAALVNSGLVESDRVRAVLAAELPGDQGTRLAKLLDGLL